MVDMNKLVVAFKDTKNKVVFNTLLLEMFNELGGAEANAVDTITAELVKAGIVCKRASVIGKLGVMGVKTIVKPKKKAPKKDPNEPTKKELVSSLVEAFGCSVNDIDTVNNMRKGQIQFMLTEVLNLNESIDNLQESE